MTELEAMQHIKYLKDSQNELINYIKNLRGSTGFFKCERDVKCSNKSIDKIQEGIALIIGVISTQA